MKDRLFGVVAVLDQRFVFFNAPFHSLLETFDLLLDPLESPAYVPILNGGGLESWE